MCIIWILRLNLVIYYLRQDDVNEAYTLIKDLVSKLSQYLTKRRTLTQSLLYL